MIFEFHIATAYPSTPGVKIRLDVLGARQGVGLGPLGPADRHLLALAMTGDG